MQKVSEYDQKMPQSRITDHTFASYKYLKLPKLPQIIIYMHDGCTPQNDFINTLFANLVQMQLCGRSVYIVL